MNANGDIEDRVRDLLSKMTQAEKIGQLCQMNGAEGHVPDWLRQAIREGRVGSILNEVDSNTLDELQRTATQESRLGIPLIFGRDVIHGFRTIMPIPLGQAATWNPDTVRAGARIAAREATAAGLHWTFAPMIDIARDPRWGRIAESLGEDPYLASRLGAAMVEGFQGPDLKAPESMAACAKHFAGYGASESGKDYNTTNIPENELRNVYLRPFKAAVEAGVATLMTSFSDLDGVPATANRFLLTDVLRNEWSFDGFVVSDWDSVRQLSTHGLTENDREAAYEAASAGLDMEMAGTAYAEHLASLIEAGELSTESLDAKVSNVLRAKLRLGLFESSSTNAAVDTTEARAVAHQAASESLVLLKNREATLPLAKDQLRSLAVIGPLADDPYEILGTWIFDGDPSQTVTPLKAIRDHLADDVEVRFVPALETTRSHNPDAFDEAAEAAKTADAAILFLGEESILSGEAHSRSNIDLPGAQLQLLDRVRKTGTKTIVVIVAGRPLTLDRVVDKADALLYAWHPGTMGGPAIADTLFGAVSPSGKLPVSFPRTVGQIPLYYNHKHTGRPATPETIVSMDDIPPRAAQTSLGMTSFHLDVHPSPMFCFGFGLSYARYQYGDLRISAAEVPLGQPVEVSAMLSNVSEVDGVEVVQLYIRDVAGSTTRPVKELKAFRRVHLKPGQTERVSFTLGPRDLAFYGRDQQLKAERGEFIVWIGGDSSTNLCTTFRLT